MFTYDLTSAMHIPFALCPTVLQSPAEKDALVSDQPHAASVIYLCLFFSFYGLMRQMPWKLKTIS